jgi:class 3 adenylate cyclase
VRCAQEIVASVEQIGLSIRAGIHIGECEIIDGKVGGLTVTIGARVAAKAGPSEILITQTIRELVAGSGFAYLDGGEHVLKGVPDSWHLWSVVQQ